MLVQQERTKSRQWAGAERKEDRHATNNAKSGDDEVVKIDFRTGYLRSQLLKKDPGRLGKHETFADNLTKAVFSETRVFCRLVDICVCDPLHKVD